MKLFENDFKRRLKTGERMYGLWLTTASPVVAELAATADFDWLLIDGEHGPNDVHSILAQLQAIAPYRSSAIVRPLEFTEANVKQVLDLGAQTILLPMISTAEEAERAVESVKYPPRGTRGVGAALARAARWDRIEDYSARANEEICLLIQIETTEALDNLDEILAVEGIDGIFVGPGDLSASLGLEGQYDNPEVLHVFETVIRKACAAGRAAGAISSDKALADKFFEWGATFMGIGVDARLYSKALDARLGQYR